MPVKFSSSLLCIPDGHLGYCTTFSRPSVLGSYATTAAFYGNKRDLLMPEDFRPPDIPN